MNPGDIDIDSGAPSDPDFEQLVFDVDPPELPSRFVEDPRVINSWQPPKLSAELEFDHVFGGGVLDVVEVPVEVNDTRILDRQIRRLPATLRRPIASLRTAWHRQHLFDLVDREVKIRTGISNLREIEVPGELFTRAYLPEIYRRAALRAVAADTRFVRGLVAEASRIKADGHLVRLFGGPPPGLPSLPQCSIPESSLWEAESWLGLATSSMPEALPEEVLAALAQRALQRHSEWRHRRSAPLRILHWGALHSSLAKALAASEPNRSDLEVYEVDTLGQTPPMPRVRWRSSVLPVEGNFDDALIHLPPPAEGANNLRSRYKNLALPTGTELHLKDIGRMGPRKWRRGAFKVLREVLPRIKPQGEVALVLPTSVRTATRTGRYSEWGYSSRPELADGFARFLADHGWHVAREVDLVEINPQPQPFFLTRRCTWRLMLASRQAEVRPPAGSNVEDVFL